MAKKKIDKLCDVIRGLHKTYNAAKDRNDFDIDQKIAVRAKIQLLETLLQEAAFIKKDKKSEIEIELEDVGC